MPIIFDKKTARFRDASGRFVGEKFVRGTIERATTVLQNDLRGLAKDFNAGKINLAEFQNRLAEQIKAAHVFTASAGKGGRRQMSLSDWGAAGVEIREQYKYLNRFAREIEAGTLSANQIENRAALYSKSPRDIYFKNEAKAKKAAGFGLVRRILHALETCSECVSWAAKGLIPIDEMPPIGGLICKSFCRCELEYRRNKEGFFSSNDSARKYYGPGIHSHPIEWKQTIDDLEAQGVVVEYTESEMYYDARRDSPGRIKIDEEASFSALLHEKSHFDQNKRDGFPGLSHYISEYDLFWGQEFAAYWEEIKWAKKRKNFSLVNDIIGEMRGRRADIRDFHAKEQIKKDAPFITEETKRSMRVRAGQE